MALRSLHVASTVPSPVASEIRRQLAGGATRLATVASDAEAHLRITAETTEKNILTLTGAGRVFDYQLRLKVAFQVSDAAGRAIVEPSEFELRRILSYSETAPLAKEAEEAQLFADMRREAATRILRRIAVVTEARKP